MSEIIISNDTGWPLTVIRQQPAWFIERWLVNRNVKTEVKNAEIKRQNKGL